VSAFLGAVQYIPTLKNGVLLRNKKQRTD